jgi:hypothetical protein
MRAKKKKMSRKSKRKLKKILKKTLKTKLRNLVFRQLADETQPDLERRVPTQTQKHTQTQTQTDGTTKGTFLPVERDPSSLFRAVYMSSREQPCPNFEHGADVYGFDMSDEDAFVASVRNAFAESGNRVHELYLEAIENTMLGLAEDLAPLFAKFDEEHLSSFDVVFDPVDSIWYFKDLPIAKRVAGSVEEEPAAAEFKVFLASPVGIENAQASLGVSVMQPTAPTSPIETTAFTAALHEIGVRFLVSTSASLSTRPNDLTVFVQGKYYEGLRP